MARIQYLKKTQRIVVRYLSNCFGSRLVVPEYCIDGLGQNRVPPQCNFLFLFVNIYIYMENPYFEHFNYIT